MSDDVLVERSDGLVTVTFNRPERKNALDAGCWQALDAVLAEVATSPADRALLLTGAGGNFSSGADLSGDGSGGLAGGEMQLIVTEMRIVGEIIRRLQRLPKPTLAAVDGFAVGVAFGLALACDLVVASDRARFCAIFAKRGLALDGGSSWTLPRQIGLRRAKQMAYFGDMVEAPQALDWGLVNEVVPAEELAETALAWARRLADGSDHGPQPQQAAARRQRGVELRGGVGGRGPVPTHHLHDGGHGRGHQRLPRAARAPLHREVTEERPMTSAIDCLVNVDFGDEKQPEWMVRVKEDYFKGGDSFFRSPELPELLEDMDANGVERAILMTRVGADDDRAQRYAAAEPDRFALAVGGLQPAAADEGAAGARVLRRATTRSPTPWSGPASGATACTRPATPSTTRSTRSAASSTCRCA